MKRKLLPKNEIILFDKKKTPSRFNIRSNFRMFKLWGPMNENVLLGSIMFHKHILLKNFFFYTHFLNFLRSYVNRYYFNNFVKNSRNIDLVTPMFLYKKQSFSRNIEFSTYLYKNKIFGFFLFKKLNRFNLKYFYKFSLLNLSPGMNYGLINLDNEKLKNLNVLNEIDPKKTYFYIKHKYNDNVIYSQNIFINSSSLTLIFNNNFLKIVYLMFFNLINNK